MKLCRFVSPSFPWPHVGVLAGDGTVMDLSGAGVRTLTEILESDDGVSRVQALAAAATRRWAATEVQFLSPVEGQEVWAAGVTYLRSKTARMEESKHAATAYDLVYDAERPELFFKSTPGKVVAPLGRIGIRKDARWNVPEPELALVINSKGRVVGYTAGNDVSSRDIEGENLLYLPQAKVYRGSCALGPWVTLGVTEEEVRSWTISLRISRGPKEVFSGSTQVGRIKRSFAELAGWLCRSQTFDQGAVLLTGTGVVPPDQFTLAEGDIVSIELTGVGQLTNEVEIV